MISAPHPRKCPTPVPAAAQQVLSSCVSPWPLAAKWRSATGLRHASAAEAISTVPVNECSPLAVPPGSLLLPLLPPQPLLTPGCC
jgi:hypothetical protein